MRAGYLVSVVLTCSPVAADPGAIKVGLSCEGVLPDVIVIQALGPALLAIRIGDLFEACVEALVEQKRWRAAS
jgi:hypothetical protein